MKSKWLALLGALLLTGCAASGTILDRPGATVALVRADHDTCHELVKRQPEMFIPPQGSLAGAAAAGAIAGVAGVIQEEKAVDVCMAQRGYVDRTLTDEEKRRITATPRGPARDAALDAVMRANDAAPAVGPKQ